MKLALSSIRIDGGTQPREKISLEVVANYAERMTVGDVFPSVVVFFDGTDYWLADGFHRFHASRKIEALDIEADVKTGTQRDAILFSVGANATNGMYRSNTDKHKSVMTMLEDPEWTLLTDREIARQCAVSHTLVDKLRGELATVASDTPTPAQQTTSHGGGEIQPTADGDEGGEDAGGKMVLPELKKPRFRKRDRERAEAIKAELEKNDGASYAAIAERVGARRGMVEDIAKELGLNGSHRAIVTANGRRQDVGAKVASRISSATAEIKGTVAGMLDVLDKYAEIPAVRAGLTTLAYEMGKGAKELRAAIRRKEQ